MADFEGLKTLWEQAPVPFKAAILTGCITILRFLYDNDRRKWHRKWLEVGICISITWGVSSGLGVWGVHPDTAWLIAVAVGWLGADFVRDQAKEWLTRRVKK